jgi:hypothetical protein
MVCVTVEVLNAAGSLKIYYSVIPLGSLMRWLKAFKSFSSLHPSNILSTFGIMDKPDAPFLGSPFGEPSFGSLRVEVAAGHYNMCCKDLLLEMSSDGVVEARKKELLFVHSYSKDKNFRVAAIEGPLSSEPRSYCYALCQ